MKREKKKMIQDNLKKIIKEAVEHRHKECGCTVEVPAIEIERPRDSRFGDFSTNIAMKLGKERRDNPLPIAEKIASRLEEEKTDDIDKIEVVKPGFINFYMKNKAWSKELNEISSQGRKYANSSIGKGQKVQVEFISANPTGPLTLANGRGGFSGDVLANIFTKSGYNVEREYYVNDGGNQVRVLGKAILFLHEPNSPEEELYRGQHIVEWHDDHIEELKDAKDPLEIGKLAAKDFLRDLIQPAVKNMGIKFDNWFSEDEMIKKGEVDEAIKFLKSKKITYEKDNALWLKTTDFSDDKDRVLIKKDNDKTYFANDIAYHFDKFSERKFDKVVDLWGADHHGYVGRMQAATEAMGFGGKLDIIIFQMVRLIKDGKEYKMSKRKGTYVTMDDLLKEIGVKDAADVARFFFVSKSFDTHMDFDLDLAKDTSEKNPVYYVKYAYARINGILRNTKADFEDANLEIIKEPAEIDLIKKLTELPEIVESIVTDKKYPVHKFTYYITEIAEKFHKFYHDCKVISDDEELTKARLSLISATKTVLETVGEDILGLDLPERM